MSIEKILKPVVKAMEKLEALSEEKDTEANRHAAEVARYTEMMLAAEEESARANRFRMKIQKFLEE